MSFIVNFFQMIGAAIRTGEAARNHQVPSARDISILGLPANAFTRG